MPEDMEVAIIFEDDDDELPNGIVVTDVDGTLKALRRMLDAWKIPHTCVNCGTTDPKDIVYHGVLKNGRALWVCKCGRRFEE